MPKLALRYIPIGQLRRADVNAKLHADDSIVASLQEFGLIEPLLLDGRTGKLVAGHGRIENLERAEAEGADPPDGVTVVRGEWRVPVVVGWNSADDDEAHALGVTLNRTRDAGGWIARDLHASLERLMATRPDALPAVGFTQATMDELTRERPKLRYGEGNGSGAGSDTSLDAKAKTYATNGIRSFVLDYTLAEYEELQQALSRLRRDRKADTNAVVVHELVRAALR